MASPLLHHLHLQMDEIHNFLQMESQVLVLWKRALIRETGLFRNHATDCCPSVPHGFISQGFNGDPTSFVRRPCVRKLEIMRAHFRAHVLSHEHAETLLDALFTRDHLVDLAVEDAEDVRAQRRCLILVAQYGMQQWVQLVESMEHMADMIRFLYSTDEPQQPVASDPYEPSPAQSRDRQEAQQSRDQDTPPSDTGHRVHVVVPSMQPSAPQNRKSLVRSPPGQRTTTTTTKSNGGVATAFTPPAGSLDTSGGNSGSAGPLYAPRPTRAVHIPSAISV
jgi:hypothetical protein